jgi:hypothetical protein
VLQFPPPTEPWTDRRWFRGLFVQGERSEGPFQIGMDLNTIGTAVPVGYVIGDDTAVDRLAFPRGPLRLVSVDEEPSRIGVDGVHVHRKYTRAGGDTTLNRLIAEFSAATVRIDDGGLDSPTAAVFLINGLSRFWPAWLSNEHYQDASFAIDDFSIAVQPYEHFRGRHERLEPVPRVMSATVRRDGSTPVDLERFVSGASEVIDDVLTLMSLLHRGRLQWHERHLHSNEHWIRTNRHFVNRSPRGEERDYDEHPIVKIDRIYEFLQTGRTGLRRWRDQGDPLELAMAYRVSSDRHGAATITQRFTSLFLSLESLTGIHAKRRKLRQIVKSSVFDNLIKPVLRNALVGLKEVTETQRQMVEQKLIELNRPNFRDVLEHLASEYGVTWKDLYPSGDPPDKAADFVAVRNKLFHGAQAVSDHRLLAEINRLQLFLDRLFLRMLGWEDISDVWSVVVPFLQKEWTFEPLAIR